MDVGTYEQFHPFAKRASLYVSRFTFRISDEESELFKRLDAESRLLEQE
jgi:hypothetical protein